MAFTPSKYQQRIHDFIERGAGNAVINAVAGSGKTMIATFGLAPVTMRETVGLRIVSVTLHLATFCII